MNANVPGRLRLAGVIISLLSLSYLTLTIITHENFNYQNTNTLRYTSPYSCKLNEYIRTKLYNISQVM